MSESIGPGKVNIKGLNLIEGIKSVHTTVPFRKNHHFEYRFPTNSCTIAQQKSKKLPFFAFSYVELNMKEVILLSWDMDLK